MSDVADSVSNPQSPVNGILLGEPLTLDFDPMSFQLSSPTETKPPVDLVDSSPEDPPFANEPSEIANDTNYKYNPKSYLLDLESLQELQANIQSTSSATQDDDDAMAEEERGQTTLNDTAARDDADQRPDLLVGVRVTTSPGGHQAFILEEDEDELDLTDPKSEDDSREVDLSVDASDSSSSLNPESSSPLNGGPPGSSPTAQQEDVVGSPLANLPEDGVDEEETPTPPVRGESRRGGSSVQIVDLLTSPLEEGLGSPGARVNGTAVGQSIAECISYQVTTPDEAESRPEAIPEEEEEVSDDGLGGVSSAVQELASFVGESADAPQDDQFVDYVVSTPEDEDDSACNIEDNFTSPVPEMSRETSSAMSSDMDTSSRTTSVETVACASPLNPQQDANALRSPQGGENTPLSPDRRDESLEPTRSPNNLCTTPVLACSPTDTAEAADSPELESSEDEFEYTPAGVTKSSVTKSKRVVASARTSSKEGITLQQSSITSTSRVDSHTEVVTGKGGGAYDGLNGVTEKTELTNGTDDDYYRPEIECPVSVSKLKDVYISSGKDTVDAEAFREIAVTGIDIKSLKCQYERTIKENGILSPTREVISTGIDFESLKHSYISPLNNKNQVLHHRFAEDIVPIDIKSLKSSFTSVQEQESHNNESGVIEEVKIDKQRLQNKFNKIKIDESKCFCRKCGTHVYPVERIIAEKNFYHKNCFRCKECNKLLSVDGYMSHEAEIYCKIHFKQLFQPKARFDNDGGPPVTTPEADDSQEGRQRRHEMIIRENIPEELPPDVVRCDTKTDDGLHNINLDLGNIRQRFESPQESVPSVADRSALGRSESLLQRLEKYQSVAAGERNGDAHSPTESEDEDSSVVRETKTKEKVVYEGLSSLKSQWESGAVSSHQERTEETKEELAKLRKKMCLGRSESMRQVYQKAVEDANRIQAGRAEQISVEGQEARATSIKEKFEAGVVTQETEAEKIERLQREKEEELSVFNETGIAHEAKNIFKQLDAEVARQSGAPSASLARSPSNRWNVARPQQNAVSPGDVVRSSDPVRDVEVATTEVSERFKFFENFKDDSNKQRKRFEMTPPRESGKEPSPEFQPPRDPNVVRAADPAEEVIVTDTARRMRERFRELEVNASREEPPQGPKPLKRITPPREYTRDNAHEPSPEVQRDPDIVQCSYRVEDDIVVEADRAKSMRARFENWDAEREARESRRNGENADEECLPMADTAKTLRAKFEAIRDESERQEAHRPKPKVNRFV
uniref:Transcription factor l2 n=1 Tax=Rhipicephalus appendiculatus TaxID=34631 RepID=A0A131YKF7_RHIAP